MAFALPPPPSTSTLFVATVPGKYVIGSDGRLYRDNDDLNGKEQEQEKTALFIKKMRRHLVVVDVSKEEKEKEKQKGTKNNRKRKMFGPVGPATKRITYSCPFPSVMIENSDSTTDPFPD